MEERKARSIWLVLNDRDLDCHSKGEDFTVKLPDWVPTEIDKDSLESLCRHLTPEGVLYLAMSQLLIKLRAAARGGYHDKQTGARMNKEQQMVMNFTVSVPSNPLTRLVDDMAKAMAKGSAAEAKEALLKAGYTIEDLMKA